MMIRDAKEKDIPRILTLYFYPRYDKIYHRRIERDFKK